jgi:hypothetical protein
MTVSGYFVRRSNQLSFPRIFNGNPAGIIAAFGANRFRAQIHPIIHASPTKKTD